MIASEEEDLGVGILILGTFYFLGFFFFGFGDGFSFFLGFSKGGGSTFLYVIFIFGGIFCTFLFS